MTWFFWLGVIVLVVGIAFCFSPLALYLREGWDTYRHRRYMRKLLREYAENRPKQMSESWKRTHAYDRDGDAA